VQPATAEIARKRDENKMIWKIILVLGILGLLLGLLVTGVSVALPIVNGPRTSWEEAMYGIVPGVFVLIVSFFIFSIGLVFVLKNRKRG
jgi:ABC-type antimicrobial peptide transport system permease subunit